MNVSHAVFATILMGVSMAMIGIVYNELWTIPLTEEGYRDGSHIFTPILAVLTAFSSGVFLGQVRD